MYVDEHSSVDELLDLIVDTLQSSERPTYHNEVRDPKEVLEATRLLKEKVGSGFEENLTVVVRLSGTVSWPANSRRIQHFVEQAAHAAETTEGIERLLPYANTKWRHALLTKEFELLEHDASVSKAELAEFVKAHLL